MFLITVFIINYLHNNVKTTNSYRLGDNVTKFKVMRGIGVVVFDSRLRTGGILKGGCQDQSQGGFESKLVKKNLVYSMV